MPATASVLLQPEQPSDHLLDFKIEMADYNYDTQWLLILSGILITVTVVQSFICRRLRNEHPNSGKFAGCKRAKSSYQRVRLLFGLDFLVENIWNTANGKFSQGFRERFQEYGKTHTSHILHKRIINTIEPENLEAIMKTHFEDYTILPGRKKLICTLFGEGVLATTGSDWGYSRMLVRRSVGNLNYQTCLFERSVTYLLNQILSKHQDTFDFAKFASRYTLDVAIRLILGDSDEAPKEQATKSIHQFASDFIHLGEMAKVFTVLISRIPYLADIMHWNDLKPTQKRVYWFVDGFVSRALCTRTNKESSHTDQLLEIKSSTKGDTLLEGFAKNSTDAVRIRSEILNLLLASHDSVGAALSELFYFLARKPEVWSKIRAEVEDMFQGRSPSLDGLKQMTYLRYVINEGTSFWGFFSSAADSHSAKHLRFTVSVISKLITC